MIIPRQCRGIFSSCFHSSCFPSEWEDNQSYLSSPSPLIVSIQVVFPASGKLLITASSFAVPRRRVSIQVVFPASGKPITIDAGNTCGMCFHSSCFPSEWEGQHHHP